AASYLFHSFCTPQFAPDPQKSRTLLVDPDKPDAPPVTVTSHDAVYDPVVMAAGAVSLARKFIDSTIQGMKDFAKSFLNVIMELTERDHLSWSFGWCCEIARDYGRAAEKARDSIHHADSVMMRVAFEIGPQWSITEEQ